MKTFYRIFVYFFVFTSFVWASGLKRLSLEQGLSQSVVFDIAQDSCGFIWIATQDGLNRFDGYSFKIFRFNANDSSSLSDNWTTALEPDGNFLWIGTHHGGINRLDLRTEKVRRLFVGEKGQPDLSNVWIQDILKDTEGNLWIATWGKGLIYYSPVNHVVRIYDENSGLSNNFVSCVWQNNGQIFAGTKKGLNVVNTRSNVHTAFFFQGIEEVSRDNFITSVFDFEGYLVLGTLNGLKRFAVHEKQLQPFHLLNEKGIISPENCIITALLKDEFGALWVGTKSKGLFRIVNHRVVSQFSDQNSEENSISAKYVRCLFLDRTRNLWIGTWGGGVNVLNTSPLRFKGIYGQAAKRLFGNPMINALLVDRKQRLWVGTSENGVTVLDRNMASLFSFKKNNKKKAFTLVDDRIHAIAEDNSGNIWIGTQMGLNKWDGRSIRRALSGYSHRLLVWKFFVDHTGALWISHLFGLIQLDPITEKYHEFTKENGLPGDDITTIFEDSRGHIWVGSRADGLMEMIFSSDSILRQPTQFRYYRYQSGKMYGLTSNNILSITAMPDSVLWIGTNQGLNRLSLANHSFRHYFQSNGLPNDVIYSIVPDNKGQLWIATNRGLCCFNPTLNRFRNYTPDHGLQSYEFNQGAFFEDRQGNIYFGGINGLNYFHPDSIKPSSVQPQPVITNIFADGAPVAQAGIHFLNQFKVSYKIHTLSFEFSALEFLNPDLIQYTCFMEGIDRQWHRLEKRHSITYTNLPPGAYRFHIRASNREGVWSPKIASIDISIPPPFWTTWWFILLMGLLLIGLLAFLITYRVRQLLAIERFQHQIAADLHDEIGAGLTEINILSAVAETRIQNSVSELIKIGDRSRSLMDEMNDIIWLIKPRDDRLENLFVHLKESFNDVLEAKNISFFIQDNIRGKEIKLRLETKHHLYLLFKEAVNNAVKYSNARQITLTIKVSHKNLTIILEDDGIGFDPRSKSGGNGLKNMHLRAEQLKGHLTIESIPNRGTRIIFTSKLKKKKL